MDTTYVCVVCGKEFSPVRSAQKYCSVECRNRAGKNDRRFSGVRDYVIGRDNFRCAQCGSQSGLIVHHKDWIRTNNDPYNLITLCRSCHKKEHFLITDQRETKKCVICGADFHPLETHLKSQVLCRRRSCTKEYKKVKKRKHHDSVSCIICGKEFVQKHLKHSCCSRECRKVRDERIKAKRYVKHGDELRAKQVRYYAEHREERKAYIRKWQAAHPEKVKEYKSKHKRLIGG